MAFSDKTYTKQHSSFKNAKNKASTILQDPDRLRKLLANSVQKIREIGNDSESLQKLKHQVNTLNRMIRAYSNGSYRHIPWKNMLMVTAGIIYFVTPLDFIPDFIPVIGYLDDLTILMWVFNSIKESIEEFEEWESTGVHQVK